MIFAIKQTKKTYPKQVHIENKKWKKNCSFIIWTNCRFSL